MYFTIECINLVTVINNKKKHQKEQTKWIAYTKAATENSQGVGTTQMCTFSTQERREGVDDPKNGKHDLFEINFHPKAEGLQPT